MPQDYSLEKIVVLATFELGGENEFIDTEDIAIKANELAPGRFSWRKYPKNINLVAVRVAIADAKKKEHGVYLSGSLKKGWMLTHAGLQWASVASKNYSSQDKKNNRPIAGAAEINRYNREKRRILSTEAWKLWMNSKKDITELHAKVIFRIDSYANEEAKAQKVDRLRKLMSKDAEATKFLNFIAKRII